MAGAAVKFTPRPAQALILAYSGGKMGISAVPGSGKTHTLSALAASIIQSGKVGDNQEVLIVTLVNSAVDNFSTRIKEFLGLPMPFGYRVRTLHGLAHDIVREKPAAVGLEERFNIIDEREAAAIRKDAAMEWLAENPQALDSYLLPSLDDYQRTNLMKRYLPELVNEIALAYIRTAKDARLNPAKIRVLLDEAPTPLPLAEMGWAIYRDYQSALNYRAAVDFDDLIRLAIDLLENEPEYLERLRARWPFILEDEAQDSSKLQEQILRLLAGREGNWVRVGDPNQAIFETFTTASPEHLIRFVHDEAEAYRELPNSGRCQPAIIALANQLIHWVNNDHPEPLVRDALTVPFIQPTEADDPQPNPPEDRDAIWLVEKKYSADEEIEAVVRSVAKWLPEHPEATAAVLVPRNTRGSEFVEAFKRQKIEVVELLGSTFSTRVAATRMGEVVSALADPGSPLRLSKAYSAWRSENTELDSAVQEQVVDLIRKCETLETYISPHENNDWLEGLAGTIADEVMAELVAFQSTVRRWQRTILLPIDQMILTLSQDLYTSPGDLALAHKLAMLLQQLSLDHTSWRLPELNGELLQIAHNQRRFIGFDEDDSGFDPSRHPGKIVVTTMHKAKGLEWDRVYLTSVNAYDFPSDPDKDSFIAQKWFILRGLDLQAESLAQLDVLGQTNAYRYYDEGRASIQARLDYIRERLRLFYVGLTRAKKDLIITWNSGRRGDQKAAAPFEALISWWKEQQ